MMNEPKCFTRNCKHFIGVKQIDEDEQTEFLACKAFPEGIPDEIAYGENLHSEPMPDQGNKIVFEKGD